MNVSFLGKDAAQLNFSKVCREMKALLVLFTLENLAMCFPLFVLSYSIYQRNDYLSNSFPYGPVGPELRATKITFTLVVLGPLIYLAVPVIQVRAITSVEAQSF